METLQTELKKIVVNASTKIHGSDDPFAHPTSRFQILNEIVDFTGIAIPNKDLSSIDSSEALCAYLWERIESESAHNEDASGALPLASDPELPPNLKLGKNEKVNRASKLWPGKQA
eukprot:jgi/Bigna1/130228/aug1.10_g4936